MKKDKNNLNERLIVLQNELKFLKKKGDNLSTQKYLREAISEIKEKLKMEQKIV